MLCRLLLEIKSSIYINIIKRWVCLFARRKLKNYEFENNSGIVHINILVIFLYTKIVSTLIYVIKASLKKQNSLSYLYK